MEEDIKVLEEFIEEYNASYPNEEEWVVIYPNQVKAIENLIKRNKELEVINKMQEYRISVIDERELIPKSKVREKIEELEDFDSIANDYDYIYARGQYELCLELLKEGDDK